MVPENSGSGCVIQYNTFDHCVEAVDVQCDSVHIIGNIVENTETAFFVHSYNNNQEITGNDLVDCGKGVYVESYSTGSLIDGNHMAGISEIGIDIETAGNTIVTGNNISGSGIGIYVQGDDQYALVHGYIGQNVVCMNGTGIQIDGWASFDVFGNTLRSCLADGIMLTGTQNNTLYANVLTRCSIDMEGSAATFIYQDIPINNTVNGMPVYYYSSYNGTSLVGVHAPSDAGELIYGDLNGFVVGDVELSNQTSALITGYCDNFNVTGCMFGNDTPNAFRAQNCYSVSIQSNHFLNDKVGFEVDDSTNTYPINNQFLVCGTGIRLDGSSNEISANELIGCVNGIASYSNNNYIHDNQFANCSNSGYYGSNSNDEVENNVFNTSVHGVYLESATLTVQTNNFTDCDYGVYAMNCYGLVSDNIVAGCGVGIGCYADYGSSIDSNIVNDCNGTGILSSAVFSQGYVTDSGSGTRISENTVGNCTVDIGIIATDECEVSRNTVFGGQTGILVNGSQDADINDNLVQGAFDGIMVEGSRSSSEAKTAPAGGDESAGIDGNTISGSGHIGISLMSSIGVPVTNNLITDSVSYGLLSNLSYGCTIDLNRFIDNNGAGAIYSSEHVQAYDDGFVYADRDPPVYDSCDPYDGYITADNEVDLDWEVYDDGSGMASSRISVDGGPFMQPDYWEQDYGSTWEGYAEYTEMSEGNHIFEICSTDNSGNQAFKFVNVTVDYSYDGPTFDEWEPSDGRTASLTGDYFDWWVCEGDYAVTGCDLLIDGSSVAKSSWSYSYGEWYGESYSFDTYELAAGWHQIEIVATDSHGNVATMTEHINLVAGKSGPIAPEKKGSSQSGSNTNSWSINLDTELGNYWSDWLNPDANHDSIVDMPYHIAGANVTDRAPLAYLVAIPCITYVDPESGYVYLGWTTNYSLINSNGSDLFRNSTDGNEVFPASGGWYQDLAIVPYGNYTYSVRVDDNGFVGMTSASVNVRIPDSIPPELQIVSPIEDDYVGHANVSWVGNDYESGIDHYEVSLNEGDPMNVGLATNHSFTDAQSGWNTVYVTAYDVAGNSVTEQVDFYLDNTGPAVVLFSPTNGFMSNADDSGVVHFGWTAADADTDVSSVWMVINGSEPVNVTAYQGSMNLPMADGNYTVEFYAIDSVGNVGTSSSVSFTVDTVAPTVSISSPSDQSYVGGSSCNLVWTAQDSGSGIDSFQVYVNGIFYEGTSAHSMEITGLSPGYNLLEVLAYDNASNYNSASVGITVDTQAPAVQITYPLDGMIFDGTYEGTVHAYWNAWDNQTGISHIDVRLDDGNWAAVGHASDLVFSNVADGNHTLTVRAYDMAGLMGQTQVQFVFDSTAPVISITSPSQGAYLNTANVNVNWTAHDASTSIVSYQYDLDGQPVSGALGTSFELTQLTEGTHTFTVNAFDQASNEASASVTFYVDVTRPNVHITAPIAEADINQSSYEFVWNGNDSGSGIAGYQYKLDVAPWSQISTGQSVTLTGLTDGVHGFFVRAIDRAGNVGLASPVGFYLDATAPVLTITSPVEGKAYNLTTGNDVNITWSGVDEPFGIDHYSVFINGECMGAQTASFLSFPDMPEGTYQIEVRAFDHFGNVGQSTVNMTVDMTAPTLTIDAPTESIYNVTSMEASWTGSDSGSGIAGYQYSLDGLSWSEMGQLSNVVLTGLTDGNHTFLVRAMDKAGNTVQTSVNFTVDASAPTLTITSPAEGSYFNHTAGNDVTVTWSSSDEITGVTHYMVRVNGGSSNQQTSASVPATSPAWQTVSTGSTYGHATGPGHRPDQRELHRRCDGAGAGHILAKLLDLQRQRDRGRSSGSDATSGCEFSYRLDSGAWSVASAALGATLSSLGRRRACLAGSGH